MQTQGLSAAQARWLTIFEHGSAIVVSSVIGSLTGIGVALVFEPILRLTAFTGGELETGLIINPAPIGALTVGLIVVLFLVAASFGYINRDADLGRPLRAGVR